MKKETAFWLLLTIFAFLFSSALMWQTFSYDSTSSSMLIAPKAWSDFGAHIPLIRSFSFGKNWPPESPLFPGTPIQYHYLFYYIVGNLEKAGIRIDFALNIPSILGMTALIMLIAVLAKKLFSKYSVAVIAVVLFCFNSSLSYIRFFEKHPLSLHTPMDIITNTAFPAFGPWDGGLVSAFWNMNIYTNQRHLGLSYAFLLIAILLALQIQQSKVRMRAYVLSCGIAITMITLLFLHQAAALIAALWIAWIWVLQKKSRVPLLFAALLSVSGLSLYMKLIGSSGTITFDPGYLALPPLTYKTIIAFWWHNLGLSLIMIPFGFIVSPKKMQWLLGVPLLILFIIPNLWRFSPDMINNHKFFNFFIIMGNMLTAYGVVKIFDWIKIASRRIIRLVGYWCIGALLLLLTLSGIIDLFPIFNEQKGMLFDTPASQDVHFFLTNTPPDAIVLNSTWFYHPASLAGRKIFSGYTYFTWSYGYDQTMRETQQKAIYEATTKEKACLLLRAYHINYIELSNAPEKYLKPNYPLFQDAFTEIYNNPITRLRVYDVNASCQPL